jgi:hypothetical protein
VAPVATDLHLPGFPAIAFELGVDASGVQLTLTSFLIGMAVGRLVPVAARLVQGLAGAGGMVIGSPGRSAGCLTLSA